MATKRTKPSTTRKPREKKNLRKVLVRLDPADHDALRREALKRAVAAGSLRPDLSELIRAAIKEWLRKKTP